MGFVVHPQSRRSSSAAAIRIRWRSTCTISGTSTWRRPASGASRRRPTSWRRWPKRCEQFQARGRPAGARRALPRRTAHADRGHGEARLHAVSAARDPGADHRRRSTRRPIPRYDFKAFYDSGAARGFILYPGKLTQVETFRVGCIGAIGEAEMEQAVAAIAAIVREMGITQLKPAAKTRAVA